MIHLFYSNHIELLIDALTEKIYLERQDKISWKPIKIVTTDTSTKEYILLELSKRIKTTININIQSLYDFIQDIIYFNNYRVININILKETILYILQDQKLLTHNNLLPIYDYLNDDLNKIKTIQLASVLAHLYIEYTIKHPNWLKIWHQSKYISNTPTKTEIWQQYLWQNILYLLNHKNQIPPYTILADIISSKQNFFNPHDVPSHIIGINYIPKAYYQLLTKLQNNENIYIYHTNPCKEFWEDVSIKYQMTSPLLTLLPPNTIKRNTKQSIISSCHPLTVKQDLLQLWAIIEQRNSIRLNNLSDYTFHTCFKLSNYCSILNGIRNDVLMLHNSYMCSGYKKEDTSTRFLAFYNEKDESEAVAVEIWKLIKYYHTKHHPINFSDIALIVPSDKYYTYKINLQTEFLKHNDIPSNFNINTTDDPSTEIFGVIDILLNIPISKLTKILFLRIITNQNITRNFEKIDFTDLYKLSNSFNMEYDSAQYNASRHSMSKNTDIWNQNLYQLNLILFNIYNKTSKYTNTVHMTPNIKKYVNAGRLILFVRVMLKHIEKIQKKCKSIKQWIIILKKYLFFWLLGANTSNIHTKTTKQCIEEILNSIINMEPTKIFNYTTINYLIISKIQQITYQKTNKTINIVNVLDYSTLSNIPFKIIFLLGLNKDIFPPKKIHNQFALYNMHYKINYEYDYHIFLKYVLSARDYLYLSYINTDIVTGQILEPSYLYKDFLTLTNRYSLQQNTTKQYHISSGFNTISSKNIDNDTKHYHINLYQKNKSSYYQQIINDETGLKSEYNIIHSRHKHITNVNIKITQLIAWLECPLTGEATIKLGLQDNQESIDKDPTVNTINRYKLLDDIIYKLTYKNHLGEINKHYNILINQLKYIKSLQPTIFNQIERRTHINIIKNWLLLMQNAKPHKIKLQANAIKNPKIQLTIKLIINQQYYKINLIGNLQPQLWNGSAFFEIGNIPQSINKFKNKILHAYVNHIIIQSIYEHTDEYRAWFLFSGEQSKKHCAGIKSFLFEPMCKAKSINILTNWLQDIFNKQHTFLMPTKAILSEKKYHDITPEKIKHFVNENIKNNKRYGNNYQLVPDIQNYHSPINIKAIVNQRLGHLLNQIAQHNRWK